MAFPWQQWFMTPQSLGLPTFGFSADLVTFTPIMAKRNAPGPFAAAPITQGNYDGSGACDQMRWANTIVSNPAQGQSNALDSYQGSIVFWWTPENSRDATLADEVFFNNIGVGGIYFAYQHDNNRFRWTAGGQSLYHTMSTVAGATYCMVLRWDTRNTLDGTSYLCVSVNDTHLFGVTTAPTAFIPSGITYLNDGTANPANAILEGLTIYRRPLTDGTYGVRPMNGNQYSNDEINAIWFAGAGRDPQLVTGSEDTCLCIPTNSTVGALATGNGEAWSWPWDDNLLDAWGGWDGGLPGTDRAVEFNSAGNTNINCGSDVDIDDIHDAEFVAEAWIRVDAYRPEGGASWIFNKTGWSIYYNDTQGLIAVIDCATVDATSIIGNTYIPEDGKLHHITMHWDDANVGAARVISLAIDGVWVTSYDTQIAGTGAIVTDVGSDLIIGNRSVADRGVNGAFAWAAISNNARYTVGTDFIPPRAFPADDANYLASWPMNEGSGAAIDNIGNQGGAGSGAANRDGTLANGTWSSIWEQDATPVIPQSLEFFAENDGIDFGSGANIDDLPSADCTIEFYARIKQDTVLNTHLLSKCDVGQVNGHFIYYADGRVICYFRHETTDAIMASDVTLSMNDNRWHHYAIDWDFGTLTGRLLVDGIPTEESTAVGAYKVDDTYDCIVNALNNIGVLDGEIAVGWIRFSNTRRYTGNNFVPDARTNPPANDANAHLLVNMDDGAGVTATDTSGNGYDGTITFGATTRWNNTPDMAVDEPGAAIYGPKGYNLGSDAADDGMYEEVIVVASTDYVVFPVISIGESGRARPVIRVYDVSNAANVVIFKGPELHGVDAGAGDAAVLTVATARFVADALIGGTVYNITDGSSGVITDNTETVVTATLADGTDDDWDIGDEYVIRFPQGYCERPWQESFCFKTPVGCTLLRVYIENESGEGVMQVHQVQVIPNLVVNGDCESLTGANPDIPTGWNVGTMDAGDTESSAGDGGIIHSGAEALQFNVTASADYIYAVCALAVNKYYAGGGWHYGDAAEYVGLYSLNTKSLLQYSTTDYLIEPLNIAVWTTVAGVWRAIGVDPWVRLYAHDGAGGARYIDDVWAVALDDVSITATPASEANSAETSGLRVDGRDACTQPITEITLTEGSIKFNWTPRHDAADALDFLEATDVYIAEFFGDANDYIALYWNAANTITLAYNLNGGGVVTGIWDATGAIAADTTYAVQIDYEGDGDMILTIGGVIRIALAGIPAAFGTVPGIAHWGKRDTGADDRQADATYA